MTKEVRLVVLILVLMLMSGCAPYIVCEPPSVVIGNSCCIDADEDHVCDTVSETVEVEEEEPEPVVTVEEADPSEEFASTFAKTWNAKSYNALYNLFEKNYRLKYRQQEFNYLARKAHANKGISSVRLQKVVDGEAFYTVMEGTTEKTVVAEIVEEDGEYRHSEFYFFTELDADSACVDDVDCFEDIALITGNPNLCDDAGDLRLDCLEKLGVSKSLTAKIDECKAVADYYGKVECLENVAIKENSVEPCWEAEFDKQTFMCMGFVVAKRGDAAECTTVVSSRGFPATRQQHAYCILGFVKETHDTDACDLIDRKDDVVVGSMQEGCYKENFP